MRHLLRGAGFTNQDMIPPLLRLENARQKITNCLKMLLMDMRKVLWGRDDKLKLEWDWMQFIMWTKPSDSWNGFITCPCLWQKLFLIWKYEFVDVSETSVMLPLCFSQKITYYSDSWILVAQKINKLCSPQTCIILGRRKERIEI